VLQRLGADVAEYGFVETSAKQDGRNMTMVLAPHRGAKTRAKARHPEGPGAGPASDDAAGGADPCANWRTRVVRWGRRSRSFVELTHARLPRARVLHRTEETCPKPRPTVGRQSGSGA